MGRPAIPAGHYGYRLNQVLDFIDGHLDGDLTLEVLAEQAHFSTYHFLRLFHEWYGEAPSAYVRRRRLEAGATRLQYLRDSIADIALQCGFATADGFSRAFRQYFGVCPARWRAGRAPLADPAPLAAPPPVGHAASWPVRLETLPALRVAYTRRVGVYGEASAAQWQLMAEWLAAQRLGPVTRFGMGLDDPEFTPPARCRYDVCAALPAGFEPPPRTPLKQICGGLHAILSYAGPPEGSNAAWRWLLDEWLPASPYQLAPRAAFERYPPGLPDPGALAQDCELCLPVMPGGGQL